GMILELADYDILQLGPQVFVDAHQQIVRQRTGRMVLLDAAIDARGLGYVGQNRKGALAVDFLEIDDLLVVDFADDDPRQLHVDRHTGPPAIDEVYERETCRVDYRSG